MRAVLILLLSVGCASARQPRMISVELLEHHQGNRPVFIIGTHRYTIRIHNRSEQAIGIETISLEPTSNNIDIELSEDARQRFTDTISPGGTEEFDMVVTVTRTTRTAPSYANHLDYLEVTIGCQADSGRFVDSDVYPVTPVID